MATRITKAIDCAKDMMAHGMDAPLAIHKAAEHYALSNRLLAREMGKRKSTKRVPTETPPDAWWNK